MTTLMPASKTLALQITDASYHGPALSASNRYRLGISVNVPLTKETRSQYVKGTYWAWRNPFGNEISLGSASRNSSATISLHQAHFGRSSEVIMVWTLDCASVRGALGNPLKVRSGDRELWLVGTVSEVDVGTVGEGAAIALAVSARGPLSGLNSNLVAEGEIAGAASASSHLESVGGKTTSINDHSVVLPDLVPNVPSTRIAINAASASLKTITQGPSNPVGRVPPVNQAILSSIVSSSGSWTTLTARLTTLLGVADQIAEIHPWVKLAWGVVSVPLKIISVQHELDKKIMALVDEMARACDLTDSAGNLQLRSSNQPVATTRILQQVTQCAYFVKEYCQEKRFAMRAIENIASGVDAQIQDYMGTLEGLQRSLVDNSVVQGTVKICQVFDRVEVMDEAIQAIDAHLVLEKMVYAPEAHHSLDGAGTCLPGTRKEIIDAIVHWAAGAVLPPTDCGEWRPDLNPDARVLWLCGLSGAGKSTILRSVAVRLQEIGRLGAFYGFKDETRTTTNPSTVFSTIARDLADQDPLRKARLVQSIKGKLSIQTTMDCRLQFEHFIVEPSTDLPTIGDTVLVIDAFDESGSVEARRKLLSILTHCGTDLPPGLKLIIASRYERDVQDALQSPRPADLELLLIEHIPGDLTLRDIKLYVHKILEPDPRLARLQPEKQQLALNAEQSFQWASTACRFILRDTDGNAGLSARERLQQLLLSHPTLDGLYMSILDQHFAHAQQNGKARLSHLLGLLVCAAEPLSLRTLVGIACGVAVPSEEDLETYQNITRLLASLISGADNIDTPLTPLHTSFTDFLQDHNRSKNYVVDTKEFLHFLLLQCLSVMKNGLQFNICEIDMSSRLNTDFRESIDSAFATFPSLSYACRFWVLHLSQFAGAAERSVEDAGLISMLLTHLQDRGLEWLEVMSLLQCSPHDALRELGDIRTFPAALRPVLHDMTCFAAMFAHPIAVSIPHIYLSAVAFCPQSSFSDRFHKQYPSLVALKQGRLPHWPSLRVEDPLVVRLGTDAGMDSPFRSVVTSGVTKPGGEYIESSSGEKMVQSWNTRVGAAVEDSMPGHAEGPGLTSVAFSPDGKRIVSGSQDGLVWIWDVETGAAIGEPLRGHTGYVNTVSFSPNGMHIASGSDDGTVRLWDTASGMEICDPMRGHAEWATSGAISSSDEAIAGSRRRLVRFWDPTMGTTIGSLRGYAEQVMTVAFSPDGKKIASGSNDGLVRVWDTTTGAAVGEPMRGHTGAVRSVAFSPKGDLVASGSKDNSVRVWNAKSGAASGEPLQAHLERVTSVAFSPSGERIASGSYDGLVRIWDTTTGAALGGSIHERPRTMIRDLYTHESRTSDEERVNAVAFSPSGKHIVAGMNDGTIQIWDANTGTAFGGPQRGHMRGVTAVAISPDGNRIASCSDDGTIRVWDVFAEKPAENDRPDYIRLPMHESGWIRDKKGDLLLWIPPSYRQGVTLSVPGSKVFGPTHVTELDFTDFKYGEDWTQCRDSSSRTS